MNHDLSPDGSIAGRSGASPDAAIHRPAHYVGRDGLEARRVIEDAGLAPGFYLGNALKYVLRAGSKVEGDAPEHVRRRLRLLDLGKAKRNLEMLAEVARGNLTGGAPRTIAPGHVAASFGLGERLAVVIAILTMPHLHVCELDQAAHLIAEEIEAVTVAASCGTHASGVTPAPEQPSNAAAAPEPAPREFWPQANSGRAA